jgi:phosphoglycerate dehydrogenase-like enzyme
MSMRPRTIVAFRELPFDAAQWQQIKAAAAPDEILVVSGKDDAAIAEALKGAEIAIITGDLDARFVQAPRLKWVHCDHAGLTKSSRPAIFEKGLVVTGSAGRSGPALAEHAIMFMLMLGSRFPDYYEAQKRHQWAARQDELRALYRQTVGIIGMGHTGVELAVRCKAFGMRVLGYRRRDLPAPGGVDTMYCSDRGDTIDPILDACDVLALVVNLSDATYHMIGKREIARLKPSAIVINLSRGGVIDEAELIGALKSGRLAGAGLDVTEVEPLPKDSPLWDCPNTLITPHFTPAVPDKSQRSVNVIVDNFGRFRRGEAMRNRITAEDVFTH